ncbi:MAG: hypothetical protein AVO35_11720 [Candidatus Aegiribacteria sp. MLS_C]|nr:MAG: hypothetical protein AVO35_11720 [Candidatus Aegiribacteria sp. MLS_C]
MRVRIGGREIDLSNRDKVFFPESGITKGDLVDYYRGVAGTMVQHMRYYGVSMHRYPDGIRGEGFYQKDAGDYFPEWLKTVRIPGKEGGSYSAPVVDGVASLVYLADQAVVTPHLYLSRIDDLSHPDRMVFDLDPPERTEDFSAVRRAALDLREMLSELDITAFVNTTGSKGYHLVVPLKRGPGFDDVRDFARGVARVLAGRHPDSYTLEHRKEKRKGRVFLDTLRNSYGATAVAPYAVRALPGAPVATPLSWRELEEGAAPGDWDIGSIPRRFAQTEDPWHGIRRHGISIGSRREALDRLLNGTD